MLSCKKVLHFVRNYTHRASKVTNLKALSVNVFNTFNVNLNVKVNVFNNFNVDAILFSSNKPER